MLSIRIACCLDILVVQDEIADAIAITLKIRVATQNYILKLDIGPRGAEAFDPDLRGLAHQQSNDPESCEQANSFYRQARGSTE